MECRSLTAVLLLQLCLAWSSARGCVPPGSREVRGPFAPQRQNVTATDGWREALRILLRDGAVVLQGLLEGQSANDIRAVAGEVPRRLFAAGGGETAGAVPSLELLSPHAPVNAVHEEIREMERRGSYTVGSGLEPHTDGYAYGDDMPDFVFLVCEQTSPGGGANVLLDGHALMDGLFEGDDAGKALGTWLSEAAVDLSETSDTGLVVGRQAQGVIMQWLRTKSGALRMKWRRQVNTREVPLLATYEPLTEKGLGDFVSKRCSQLQTLRYVSTWLPLADADAAAAAVVQARLEEFDAIVQQASAEAFARHRFSLARGEALVIDNYRMLHGRTPFMKGSDDAQERRMWRVWSWTSEGSGLPPDGARTSNPLNDEVFTNESASIHRNRLDL